MDGDSSGSGSGHPPGGSVDREHGLALPRGARLGELEVEAILGEGGFGIVYLAFDHSLHRHVAVKEFLPAAYAFRRDNGTIAVRSVQHAETFNAGLRNFVQEARLLATFEHPALVRVHRFWEANGTAYMAMSYYRGQTLRDALKSNPGFATEERLKALILPLLDAVELLHGHNCFHRDISPDNIIVQPDGRPVLLDFGAARRIIGEMTHVLTAVLKPGYAPIEQYADEGGFEQGPWTDVYGFSATLFRAVTGKAPAAAVSRALNDRYVPLAVQPPPGYDLPFLRAIDAGLAVMPADRIQSIGAFRSALFLVEDVDVERTVRVERTLPPRVDAARAGGPTPAAPRTESGPPATMPPAATTPPAATRPPGTARPTAPRPQTAPEHRAASRLPPGTGLPVPEAQSIAMKTGNGSGARTMVIASCAAVALGLAVAGAWQWTRGDRPASSSPATRVAATESEPPAAATVAVAPAPGGNASAALALPSGAPGPTAPLPSPKGSSVPGPAASTRTPAAPAAAVVPPPRSTSAPVVAPAAAPGAGAASGTARMTPPEKTPAPEMPRATAAAATASLPPVPPIAERQRPSDAPSAPVAAPPPSPSPLQGTAPNAGDTPVRPAPKEESIAVSPPPAPVVAESSPQPVPAAQPAAVPPKQAVVAAPSPAPPSASATAPLTKVAAASGRCNCADLRGTCSMDARRDAPGSSASGVWRIDISGRPACALIEYRERIGGAFVKEEVRNGWAIVSANPSVSSLSVGACRVCAVE